MALLPPEGPFFPALRLIEPNIAQRHSVPDARYLRSLAILLVAYVKRTAVFYKNTEVAAKCLRLLPLKFISHDPRRIFSD
jgi:hypothetical protein